MIHMLVRNRVADFAKWKRIFDSHAEAHREAGLHLVHLWRSLEDQNNVFFLFEPKTAIDRFAQFQDNWLLGLYNLDLLNITNQIIMIPTFFALYAAHRKVNSAYATLAMIIFLVGTTIFVTNNTALPMLELSNKYAASTTESQKTLLAAAGEVMLARGAHGSPGVFIGFVLPNIAGIIMSFVMLTGKIFNKATSYVGIAGSTLILTYIIFVTFVPVIKNMAMFFAMPGGLLVMAWMIMFTIRLFQLGRSESS